MRRGWSVAAISKHFADRIAASQPPLPMLSRALTRAALRTRHAAGSQRCPQCAQHSAAALPGAAWRRAASTRRPAPHPTPAPWAPPRDLLGIDAPRSTRRYASAGGKERAAFHDADEDAAAAEALLNSLDDPPPPGEAEGARAARHRDLVARAIPRAQAACDRGSPRGMTLLGYLHRDGLGMEADLSRAEDLFTRAAEVGDPFAQLGLGNVIYERLVSHPGNVGEEHERTSPVAAASAKAGAQGGVASSGREIVVEVDESGAPMARFEMSDGLRDGHQEQKRETPADLVRRVRKARRKAGYTDQEAMAFEKHKDLEARKDFLEKRAEARKWFEMAAELGNDAAAVALANMFLQEDTAAAVELYERAAKGSHVPSAHFNLAQIYYTGLNEVEKNEKLALKHFSMAAHLGDASAQFFVGHLYRVGEMGINVDLAACLQYVQLAAAQGHAAAMYYLALMHRNGEGGLEVSRGMFRRYVQASGELEHGEALACLADMYYKGTDGVRVDYEKALSFYKRAGKAGEAEALCSAAAMTYHGHGTDADKHKAFLLYQEAAVAGSTAAMHNIGSMYYSGDGVPQSESMAEHFFRLVEERQAAEKERAKALQAKGGRTMAAPPRAMPHTSDE